jgi:hypothetical protein
MITADQLVAHLVGDYLLQSDWMASEKTKRWSVALIHGFVYSMAFLAFTRVSLAAHLVIWLSHALIDRYRLARFVVYAKNFIAPPLERVYKDGAYVATTRLWNPWSECSGTGYHQDRPAWLAVWLLIIADNTMHIIINGLALEFLG